MKFWLNGTLYDSDLMGISPMDRGLLLGDGIFETILFRQGQPECWQAHLERFESAAKKVYLPYQLGPLIAAVEMTLKANDLMESLAWVRITLSRGISETRGLTISSTALPTLLITVGAYEFPHNHLQGALSDIIYANALGVKSLNYLPNVVALEQVRQKGFDEAIMKNPEGRIICSARGNLFLKIEDQIVTPPISEGALPGICRSRILNILQNQDRPAVIREVSVNDIKNAQAIAVSNSLVGLQPLDVFESNSLETQYWHPIQDLLRCRL